MRIARPSSAVTVLVAASLAAAQEPAEPTQGGLLSDVPETVYDNPPIRRPGEGFNDGAATLDLRVIYLTDYVFRGFEPVEPDTAEDAANVGVRAQLAFDLGRLPDPFVAIRTNTAEGDEISNFQVIRPVVGFTGSNDYGRIVLAHQSFTYPDRDRLDTSEIVLDVQLNDAELFGDEGVWLGPYAFVAYDYDAFEGIYAEVGIRRPLRPDAAGSFSIGYEAHVAYIDGLESLFGGDGEGFAHYQFGLRARYDLNELLNLSRRFGQWSLEGEVHYTDGLDDDLASETQVWGGGGIVFRY